MDYLNFWDAHKKAFDEWVNFSQKATETYAGKKESNESFMPVMQDYYNQMKNIFESSVNITDPKDSLQHAAGQFKKWMDAQYDFASKWGKLYRDQSARYGIQIPETGFNGAKENFEKNMKTWQEWMEQTNNSLQGNILSKIPETMQGYYKNFASAYSNLYSNWSAFEKMIRTGITQKEIIDQYFSPKAYESFINKFMNFKTVSHPDELVAESKKYFDRCIAMISTLSPDSSPVLSFWKSKLEDFSASNFSPMFKAVLDLNRLLANEMNTGMQMGPEGKEIKAVKILRDMQFYYTVFVVKTAELQSKVYQSGSTALPAVLEEYYSKFKASQQLPEYKEFFEKYVTALESRMDEMLHTKEYSEMQAEITKSIAVLKGKYNELCELFLNDSPLVTRSQLDELAQENAALRSKLRKLEEKMEAALGKEKKSTERKKHTTTEV
jgi:chaperonin cofactor prefoldin